jgi:4-diphosphocytidyl-2-C-methyl-D-erythritol kinase
MSGCHPKTFRIEAPAKINTILKVIGRRKDGYHELVTVMVPVTLNDIINLRTIGEGIELTCLGRPLPGDEKNLAYRAAKSFFGEAGIPPAVTISLEKRIPLAAGLGGGSSDAAAVLKALNRMWGRPLSRTRLFRIAVGLGADVPFFLESGPCLATGIGDVLSPLENWPEKWYLIVTPPIEVSTGWVYGNLKLELTKNETPYIFDLLKKDRIPVAHLLDNDLEKITSARFPVIQTIKEALLEAGAEGALMSGSGPSVFGVFSSSESAGSAAQNITSRSLGEVFVVSEWGQGNGK